MAVKVHWFQIEPNLKEYEYEFTGLSTDEKPQDERVALNSLFLELDTGDFYFLKQAASSSTTKDTLLQNETVTGTKSGSQYEYQIENLYVDADSITVILDGITYTCQKIVDGSENFYGSVDFDFSEYPFAISSAEEYNETVLYFPSDDEHVIEVYTEETVTTEAVWEKVGSGGSEPEPSVEKLFEGNVTTVEDGDEIVYVFDPVVALNYSSLIVEFDGTKYTVSNLRNEDGVFEFGSGMLDWSEYPFNLYYFINNGEWLSALFTETEGTFSLKIWANSDPVDVDGGR